MPREAQDGCEQTAAPHFRCSGRLMAVPWAQVSPSHTTPGGQGCCRSRELWPGSQRVGFLLLLGLVLVFMFLKSILFPCV